MGSPIPQNILYSQVKTLLERVAPVMIDVLAVKALMTFVADSVTGIGESVEDIPNATEKGMKLLLVGVTQIHAIKLTHGANIGAVARALVFLRKPFSDFYFLK